MLLGRGYSTGRSLGSPLPAPAPPGTLRWHCPLGPPSLGGFGPGETKPDRDVKSQRSTRSNRRKKKKKNPAETPAWHANRNSPPAPLSNSRLRRTRSVPAARPGEVWQEDASPLTRLRISCAVSLYIDTCQPRTFPRIDSVRGRRCPPVAPRHGCLKSPPLHQAPATRSKI